jgi:hypothetical protein
LSVGYLRGGEKEGINPYFVYGTFTILAGVGSHEEPAFGNGNEIGLASNRYGCGMDGQWSQRRMDSARTFAGHAAKVYQRGRRREKACPTKLFVGLDRLAAHQALPGQVKNAEETTRFRKIGAVVVRRSRCRSPEKDGSQQYPQLLRPNTARRCLE